MSALSNQLSIQPAPSYDGLGDNTASPKVALPAPAPVKPVAMFANPSYQLDPTVGLMVVEFHDKTGAVSNSIPSVRQLQAYRLHQATPPGEQSSMTVSLTDAKTSAG
jgi:hypothetical protein